MSYVLLKCQNQRNFSKKKYLHKKYDENDKNWNRFLREYNLIHTKLELVFMEEEPQKMESEEEEQPDWGKMISDIANEILKDRYAKKKSKKIVNPLEQLTRIPSVISSKDSKKVITAQTKSIYTSLNEYYKETLSKNHFKKDQLYYLRSLG